MTAFVVVEAVVAIVAIIAAAAGIDWTRILLALIALGGVYLAHKTRQIHVLVNSQLEKVMARLEDAVAARDDAIAERSRMTGERDDAIDNAP